MPVFELPLEELRKYGGRNPKPDDFDAYWERALGELAATEAGPELRPQPSPARFAECFELWFIGVGGARIYAKYLRPREGGQHPAVLRFHGYTGDSGEWFDLLPWVGQGFAVAAMDVRGQGGRSEDVAGDRGTTLGGHIVRGLAGDPDKLLFRQIFLDTVQLARVVSSFPEVDANRLTTTGWSQGGGLTLACAALWPRIARAAPVFPFLCDYKRVWEMDLATEAYEGLTYYFKHFDPTHARAEEAFTKLGYIDVQHLCDRIKASVMMGTGLMDTICPPSTQFAAFNKIVAPKEIVLYPDFGHVDLPGHYDRIFEFLSQV